jgi:hypothetical protein
MRKPDWALNPAIWERAKTSVRKEYGIAVGGRFEELVQAEYLQLGGGINRSKLKSEPDPMPGLIMNMEGDLLLQLPSIEKAEQHFWSEKQRRYMWAQHPDIAQAWARGEHTGKGTRSMKPPGRMPGVHSKAAGVTSETPKGRGALRKEKKKAKRMRAEGDWPKAAQEKAASFIIHDGGLFLKADLGVKEGRAAKEGFTETSADPKELAMGIEHELEHTEDRLAANRTALDHLAEDPKYYTKLKEMEEKSFDIILDSTGHMMLKAGAAVAAQPKQALVPKQVTVQGKTGTYQAMRMVKPGEAQPNGKQPGAAPPAAQNGQPTTPSEAPAPEPKDQSPAAKKLRRAKVVTFITGMLTGLIQKLTQIIRPGGFEQVAGGIAGQLGGAGAASVRKKEAAAAKEVEKEEKKKGDGTGAEGQPEKAEGEPKGKETQEEREVKAQGGGKGKQKKRLINPAKKVSEARTGA